MSLRQLPTELVHLVMENVTCQRDLNALAQTNRFFYRWLNPRLYKGAIRTQSKSLLRWAAKNGQVGTLQRLVENGMKKKTKKADEGVDSVVNFDHGQTPSSKLYKTPLGMAARRGNLPLDQHLIERGANATAKNPKNYRPLDIATLFGNFEIVAFLLPHLKQNFSADYTKYLAAALGPAVIGNYTSIARLLLASSAPINGTANNDADDIINFNEEETPLMIAIKKGNTGLVCLLLDYDGDPSMKITESDDPPLVDAARRGHENTVKLLVDRCLELEYAFAEAMFEAARWGRESVTAYFLSKGVDPDHAMKYNRTALSYAGYQAYTGTVKALLAAGADVNWTDAHGRTPIWYAIQTRDSKVIALYEKYSPADYEPYKDMEPDEEFDDWATEDEIE
ncbi:ankyrin [Aspergillus ellipticus CBS 707.79]|uniref:Ankyrin n=1 Tax=Aspergillus ellipticus CBS 707.79 TaxID=1448320 RepID=A0A319DNP2_9EURO|nr:ankyrin [Aspergillus ellipticus CBS 707.79]